MKTLQSLVARDLAEHPEKWTGIEPGELASQISPLATDVYRETREGRGSEPAAHDPGIPNEYVALSFLLFGAAALLAVWLGVPAHERLGPLIVAGFLTFIAGLASVAEFRKK
jgi:hypothetical protein